MPARKRHVENRQIGALRPPAVQEAVKQILKESGRPMRRNEIHRLISLKLGDRVSRHSVIAALSRLAATDQPTVKRISRGLYVADCQK